MSTINKKRGRDNLHTPSLLPFLTYMSCYVRGVSLITVRSWYATSCIHVSNKHKHIQTVLIFGNGLYTPFLQGIRVCVNNAQILSYKAICSGLHTHNTGVNIKLTVYRLRVRRKFIRNALCASFVRNTCTL